MKRCAIICFLVLGGCVSANRNRYVEGTEMVVGVGYPSSSSWTVQVAEWMSGISIDTPSNVTWTIMRETATTNNLLGIFTTQTHTHTRVEAITSH